VGLDAPRREAPLRPPIARSVLTNFAIQILGAVLSLGNVLLVGKILGPTGRGTVAFMTAIAYLTSQLATLGVQWASGNFAGSEPKTRPALATNAVLLAAALGGIASGVVAGLIALVPAIGGHVDPTMRWIALAVIPWLVLQNYLIVLVLADYGFRAFNTAMLLIPVTNVTVNGLLAALDLLTTPRAFSTWVGAELLATAVLAFYVQRRLAGFGRPDMQLARRTLVFGLKAHIGRTLLLGNYRLDQWIVGAVAGARQLGLYSVAVAWAESLFYLPTALQAVQRPDVVRASRHKAAQMAATAFRAITLASTPLVIGLIVAAPFLCVEIVGKQFQGSVEQLRILAPGAFGIIALKLLGNALTAQGKPMLESAAIGLAFALTLVLDILLIPSHGGLGASIASTAAYTLGGVAVALTFSRGLGLPLRELAPRSAEVPHLLREFRAGLQRWRPADQ
jgi:O-antigen/teichoic acid export membrane protein